MFRELHIAPCSSAAGCIQRALNLANGELLENGYLLSCGPLPPLRSLDEWIRIREEYAQTLYPEFPFTFAESRRDLSSHPEIVREAESIIVWVGTGLAEQLLLVWMSQFLCLLGVDPERLRVIQYSTHPENGSEIQSVAILNPDRLQAHPPATALDQPSILLLNEAWLAITATEPWPLIKLLTDSPDSLPFLKRALRWLMYRYPDVETGLNALQMKLLELTSEQGPKATRVIGYTMSRTIDWLDWVGDAQLFKWLKDLGAASLKCPLVSITGTLTNMRETEVRLTEVGQRVLNGELNFVRLNGIDEWVGGIHLNSSTNRVWFQRNGVIVADLLRPV